MTIVYIKTHFYLCWWFIFHWVHLPLLCLPFCFFLYFLFYLLVRWCELCQLNYVRVVCRSRLILCLTMRNCGGNIDEDEGEEESGSGYFVCLYSLYDLLLAFLSFAQMVVRFECMPWTPNWISAFLSFPVKYFGKKRKKNVEKLSTLLETFS